MGIFLILSQVVLVVLTYAAHVFSLSPWAIFLPAILLVTLWVVVVPFLGHVLVIDALNPVGRPATRKKR